MYQKIIEGSNKVETQREAGLLLFKNSDLIYTAQVAIAVTAYCGFELASSDFFLFPKIKSHKRCFGNIDENIGVVKELLEDQNANFFLDRIAVLDHRSTKCIGVKEDYIENQEKLYFSWFL